MTPELIQTAPFSEADGTVHTEHGHDLDKGPSLNDTLDATTAAEASRATRRCATVAAHVAHVTFYLDVLERYMSTGDGERVDWRAIWNTVGVVSPEEWDRLRHQLRETA